MFSVEDASRITAECVTNGTFDFASLIPPPPQIYLGNLSAEDSRDFQCNWDTWNRANWGTKWGAYDGLVGELDGGLGFIQFDTAWSVPYPVIAALANRYKCQFEHRYFDEGHCFWGVEIWADGSRVSKRYKHDDDYAPLCIELKGYDPNNRKED